MTPRQQTAIQYPCRHLLMRRRRRFQGWHTDRILTALVVLPVDRGEAWWVASAAVMDSVRDCCDVRRWTPADIADLVAAIRGLLSGVGQGRLYTTFYEGSLHVRLQATPAEAEAAAAAPPWHTWSTP